MYWEICQVKDNKKGSFHLHAVLLPISLLNGQVEYSQGKCIIWHTCPADDLKKNPNECGSLS